MPLHLLHGVKTQRRCGIAKPQEIGRHVHGYGFSRRAFGIHPPENPLGDGTQDFADDGGKSSLFRDAHQTAPEAHGSQQYKHQLDSVAAPLHHRLGHLSHPAVEDTK